jgi:CDGSH-type Zn-finger protein
LKKINHIIGALVEKVQNNPSAMALIKGSEFTPLAYKAEETKKVFFCACKETNNQPLCDGSHNK